MDQRWRNRFNRYVPLAVVIVGLIVVLSSFFLVENRTAWYAAIGVGIVLVLIGFWYAAHPVFTSGRRFSALRAEVDDFIKLVRQLNAAAASGSEGEVERVKAEMLESVDRMESLAGKVDK